VILCSCPTKLTGLSPGGREDGKEEEEDEEEEFDFDDFSEMVNDVLTIIILKTMTVETRQLRKDHCGLLFT